MRFTPRPYAALVAVLAFGLLGTGCSQLNYRNAATAGNRVAIALTINGTEPPTPQQWKSIVKSVEPQLALYGLLLVDDLAHADRILRVDFTPDPLDPAGGRGVVLGWRANPLRSVTYVGSSSSPTYRSSYQSGLSTYYNSTFGYERYSDYGYSSGYYGGGSTAVSSQPPAPTTGATPPPAVRPPHPGHPRGEPSGDPGRYAGRELPRPPHHGGRYEPSSTGSRSPSSSGGSESYSSSSSSSSSSSGSYSSGSSSYNSSSSYSSSSSSMGSSSPAPSISTSTTPARSPQEN